MANQPTSDFAPTASWEMLRLRAEMLRRLRSFFDARGFLEVETPLLSADTVVDRHLDPIAVTLPSDPAAPQQGRTMWLQTSPELAMKRLLAAGGEAIYQVTRSFRAGETGRLHNPEFTIVEWYRTGDGLQQGITLLSDLAVEMLQCEAAERLSYREAFCRHAGVDPFAATLGELAAAAVEKAGAAPGQSHDENDRDAWLDLLLVACVEPELGCERPTILYDYPASQAALAKVRDGDPPLAERFELYFRGLELANGYHELLDADELRQRARVANQQRVQAGKPPLPEENRLLAAMEHGLPACCGVALGFDRLVMDASGAKSLADVIAFPIDRA